MSQIIKKVIILVSGTVQMNVCFLTWQELSGKAEISLTKDVYSICFQTCQHFLKDPAQITIAKLQLAPYTTNLIFISLTCLTKLR